MYPFSLPSIPFSLRLDVLFLFHFCLYFHSSHNLFYPLSFLSFYWVSLSSLFFTLLFFVLNLLRCLYFPLSPISFFLFPVIFFLVDFLILPLFFSSSSSVSFYDSLFSTLVSWCFFTLIVLILYVSPFPFCFISLIILFYLSSSSSSCVSSYDYFLLVFPDVFPLPVRLFFLLLFFFFFRPRHFLLLHLFLVFLFSSFQSLFLLLSILIALWRPM